MSAWFGFFSLDSLSTINIISGYYIGPVPVLFLFGGLALAGSFCLLFASDSGRKRDFLSIFLLVWLAFSIFWTINNVRNIIFSRLAFGQDYDNKKIIRVCSLGDFEGRLCRIFSFLDKSLSDCQPGSRVYIDSPDELKIYLQYYALPQWLPAPSRDRAECLIQYH